VAGARPTRWGAADPLVAEAAVGLFAGAEGIEISKTHLGRVLAAAGLSFQRRRTWKAPPDSADRPKPERIIALCKRPPQGTAVFSLDRMGPLSLRPMPGAGWAPRPARASARRLQPPLRHPLHLRRYDVHPDRLRIRMRPRRPGSDMLSFRPQTRLCYPRRLRLYWIQDNSPPTGAQTSAPSPTRTRSS
jgi:hypothetical protein